MIKDSGKEKIGREVQMKRLIKKELGHLKGKVLFIFTLLIALEIVGLLLEESLGLFFASYFIFPAIILEKYRNKDISDRNLLSVYIKMLVIYFLVIPVFLFIHVQVYKRIGFSIDNMIVLNSITVFVSSIYFGIQMIFLKKHGTEKAGSMSLRIIALLVICLVIIMSIHALYCFLTVNRDFYIVQFATRLFRKWIFIYIFSMAMISISYFLGRNNTIK